MEDEYLKICNEFPDCGFTICIPYCDLDKVVCEKYCVIIDCNPGCYCNRKKRKPDMFILHKNDNKITNRDLINCLIVNNLEIKCDHMFLEDFEINSKGDILACFGS